MPDPASRPDLAQLSLSARRPRRRWLWLLLLAAVLALAGWAWASRSATPAAVRYDTTPVERGDLVVTVIATGTVQPTTRVDISSELSGTLAAVEADFNDEVTEGQVLARLDSTNLRARLATAEAQLAAAAARLTQAEATATETAEAWTSTHALDERGLAVRSTVIAAKAAHDRAVAAVEIARADLKLAEASLEEAKTDLAKADIRSPITGIVLDRTAEKGMIVAATLNAPVLFTLAEDLSRMELQVAIDEADIGRVTVGNVATFSVDAYPGRSFPARITQLRYAPEETDGVVTYKAVLSVENEELLLRPGMTATATITVARQPQVLLVPMAALRYAPPVADTSSRSGGGLLGLIMPRRTSGTRAKVDGSSLWVLKAGQPVKVKVTPGASDGRMIAVSSEELAEGDLVITDQSSP
ncbi:efflux RND transporter periplasmic adaptor subunit [Rhodobacter sp. SGA-6-6]|uniref:efflux RND transporter periplasmic adaptor subunit n=1 Tax=Rhodobacter sp. SGA-6-6 TaxID=2710882 RepID=UPI0013EC4E41|nr:efflux RND transporter periplasmic adaptor subunit [Rhodobacter sp. SGA-6-6]NGM46587.1 efflux RND transporter periplasmic adaptor subunit [Rhodobacter sp. SGA-6-6]